MRLNVHCFLDGVVFDPLPTPFSMKGGKVWISINWGPYKGPYEDGEKQEVLGSMLHYEVEEVDHNEFLRPEDNTPDHRIQFKKVGEHLDKYRGIMYEIAGTIEGLVSISAIKPFPPFGVQQVMVGLTPDTPADKELIDNELISYTFGDVGVQRDKQNIVVGGIDQMLAPVAKASERLSALAIYMAGVRAQERIEMDIAFTSFFRVVEGYMGDGTRKVERALHKKEVEVTALLRFHPEALVALHKVLKSLSLPITSKDHNDGKGIISDIVLLRHKLMHYNLKNQTHHFYSSLRTDLKPIVQQLHRVAFFLIREDIEPPKEPAEPDPK